MSFRKAVAFTGPSNSGKTTLILKVAKLLIERDNKKVAIIKNDPKDKANFDVNGKDSFLFSQTGAEVVITSPTRTTYFSQNKSDLGRIVSMIDDFDYLLVEGLKTLPLPRIGIFRGEIADAYLNIVEAIATDNTADSTNYKIPENIKRLDLNNPEEIVEWIYKNAKSV